MSEWVEYHDLDDLMYLASLLLGDPPPVRDVGLLGAAAARPQVSAFGEDAYPDLWGKAAALLQSIVKDHPLVDGNKCLGWLATAVFLRINGIAAESASNDEVYELVISVADGNRETGVIADDLRRITTGGSEGGPPARPASR